MLPSGKEVFQAAFGDQGFAQSMSKESLLIDTSTILPADTDEISAKLSARNCRMIDAPVGRLAQNAIEGTLLFMTANNPEKMDYAMVRSCRIDYKLELGYADKYQTKAIFDTFLPNQCEHFKKFYQKISHIECTTAMLQEFLFYNRKCDNILEHMDQFMEIVDKNKPSELGSSKKDKNLYM